MPFIRECVVTTLTADGRPHLAPLGLIADAAGGWIAAPFHPSQTLTNLRATPELTVSLTDDVRIIAGLLTGRRDWPLLPARHLRPPRLAAALAHEECRVRAVTEDALRPRFHLEVVHREAHAPFGGFNRAQAAVIEAAILFSRRHLLPRAEIEAELVRLTPLVEKTAGPRESEAWAWLRAALDAA
jgi:hypothetical protein